MVPLPIVTFAPLFVTRCTALEQNGSDSDVNYYLNMNRLPVIGTDSLASCGVCNLLGVTLRGLHWGDCVSVAWEVMLRCQVSVHDS